MKTKILLAAVAAVAMSASAQAAIVNIDALTSGGNVGGQQLNLAAGTYNISAIGTADGGLYNAYNKKTSSGGVGPNVGAVDNCDASGMCVNGWENSFRIVIDGVAHDYFLPGTGRYATDLQALAAAKSGLFASFTLLNDAAVTFNTTDTGFLTDNSGGLSLDVAAVPEPASWAMLILGMGAIGYSLRSAKRRSESKFDARIQRIAAGATA